jgi:hypothetical protein
MGKKSDLSLECQKFGKKLFAFFSKEEATKKPIFSFVADRKILQVRYLTYEWLFYKVHLLPPEKLQQNRTKYKISSEYSLS